MLIRFTHNETPRIPRAVGQYFWAYPFFTFYFFFFRLFSCCFRAHFKIVSRIVSYRNHTAAVNRSSPAWVTVQTETADSKQWQCLANLVVEVVESIFDEVLEVDAALEEQKNKLVLVLHENIHQRIVQLELVRIMSSFVRVHLRWTRYLLQTIASDLDNKTWRCATLLCNYGLSRHYFHQV